MDEFTVVPLREGVRLPEKAYKFDAGFDVYAPEPITINAGKWAKIPLGFGIELKTDTVCIMMEKSGLAARHGIFSIAGVIDASYRGEVHAVMANLGSTAFYFKKGDKIAQFIVFPCYTATNYRVGEGFSNSLEFIDSRGDGGFGSSGR